MDNYQIGFLVAEDLGCFTDNLDSRTLKEWAWKNHSDMTTEWCFRSCAQLNYTFHGVEYGNECFCGHELSPPGLPTDCNGACMRCSGDQSQCCGDSNIISVFTVSTVTTTLTVATGPSSIPLNATPTNQLPSQSFSKPETSSPLTHDTSVTTTRTPSVGSSRTETISSGATTCIDSSPPLSSESSTVPSHSSPWPDTSNSSTLGPTTNSGSSASGASQTQITIPTSSTGSSSVIISPSTMPASPSLSSGSMTQPIYATVSGHHSSQTHRPSPTTVLSDPGASSNSTLPSPSLPSSSETTDAASPDAVDGGLNKAIIAGAAIGGAALIAVIVFGIWFLRKIKKKPDDDDISMVGMPRDEDLPLGMRNGIRRVRGNDDWN